MCPAKVFSLEICVEVKLIHPVSIVYLFHERDAILFQSSVVQCDNIPAFKHIK